MDLTNMGDLPVPLRRFFNNTSYTTWASLATTSNITAGGRTQTGEAWLSELLPFVDSVATVGWNYSSGAVTTTVENRGENLFKIQEFKDYINTYDSSALYYKDEGYDVVEFRNGEKFENLAGKNVLIVDEDINVGLVMMINPAYRDWETDRKSTRLNSSHITRSRMPSSA